MATLQALRPVGLNTDFIRDHPLGLVVQAGFLGSSDVIELDDGTPFIKVERDLLSAKHRMHFIDVQSDQKLFEMMKERLSSDYYAEHPDGSGRNLFDINIQAAFMGGPTVQVSFNNVADSGVMTRFDCKVHTFDSASTVLWDDQPVAEIEKHTIGNPCSIHIAPCVDPLPIIALVMALEDRRRKKKKGMRGAPAGFNGTNMGTAAWQGAVLGGSQ